MLHDALHFGMMKKAAFHSQLMRMSSAAVSEKSLLSDKAILRMMEENKVFIRPFKRSNLSTSSYDVTLGDCFYREAKPCAEGNMIYNPFSKKDVDRVWGTDTLYRAENAGEWMRTNGVVLENIDESDAIIWIAPGETILGHTLEFIGGRDSVTTMMKARSSLGRNFIEVCKCAGWGDIGYVNRWTMEITNNSCHYSIPLVVGRRIAQIVFFDSEGTLEGRSYADSGKYQTSTSMKELVEKWSPTEMLPKMYLDREIFQKKAENVDNVGDTQNMNNQE